MPMWEDQLRRVERYYRRCEGIKTGATIGSVEDDNDTIYSFFIHCYHLRDWLNRDSVFEHDAIKAKSCSDPPVKGQPCTNPKCGTCYLEKTPALKLCQDICNGIKHLNSNGAMPGREVSYVDESVGFYVRSRPREESGHNVDTRQDAFKVIAEARDAWKKFIIETGGADISERGGVVSEELYEWLYGAGAG